MKTDYIIGIIDDEESDIVKIKRTIERDEKANESAMRFKFKVISLDFDSREEALRDLKTKINKMITEKK